jgi:gas vesicle protein
LNLSRESSSQQNSYHRIKQVKKIKEKSMKNNNNVSGVLIGVLIGGLAGAATMLLFAPQAGRETREVIQKKSMELRDRTSDMVGDAMTQVRSGAQRVTAGGRKQLAEIKEKGKDMATERLDRVSDAIHSSREAVKNS